MSGENSSAAQGGPARGDAANNDAAASAPAGSSVSSTVEGSAVEVSAVDTGAVKANTVEAKLAELGLSLPAIATPLAAYAPAVRSGSYVYTSGQLPTVDGQLQASGKVGAEVSAEQAYELARTAALNALAAIKGVIGDLDRVKRIVKVVGFVASAPDFTAQPGVVNGASELLGSVFGEVGTHARSAVGVSVLPIDAPVEIEIVAEVA